MAKYICWGDDKEDLTEKVVEKAREKFPFAKFNITSIDRIKSDTETHIIHVVCSKGHDNIFEVQEK